MLKNAVIVGLVLLVLQPHLQGEDYFLTIGGGYSPSGNQASLEKNVLFYQRLLAGKQLNGKPHALFFADGDSAGLDLQVMDRNSVPRANQLMAEFFGSNSDLGLSYRNHQVPNVRGASKPLNVRLWLEETGPRMKRGDRLVVYVTTHGKGSDDRQDEYNTSISMWNGSSLKVSDFVGMLDKLPEGVEVVAVMVQCHAGGFARFIYNDADPKKGLSSQKRTGFFATVHDRQAAGCTPDVDEASYVEYSTYFWAAVAGRDRLNAAIELPDYDGDGRISFAEAHAYTLLTADTIDLPIKTSGEFLHNQSRFRDERYPDLLSDTTDYSKLLTFANPVQKAILEGLSGQLQLNGENRLNEAYEKSRAQQGRSRFSRGRPESPGGQLKRKIADSLKRRWPGLANLMNPISIELVTRRSDEFVKAIEGHEDYRKYREQVEAGAGQLDASKQRVKYERFLRIADNVILAENLKRLNVPDQVAAYQQLSAAESQSL